MFFENYFQIKNQSYCNNYFLNKLLLYINKNCFLIILQFILFIYYHYNKNIIHILLKFSIN